MKIQSIRCDVCAHEVFYEDTSGKKNDFPSYIEVNASGKKTNITGYFCSPECLVLGVWEPCCYGRPSKKDIAERLSKHLGFKIVEDKPLETS